ncbi:MAG: Bug family tripartite tricarboxylate transporter substrate binding protein, partial [Usitatibacter sp.]
MPSIRALAAVSLLALAAHAHAQGYPSKPVKIIVAFTAGSATDIIARVTADEFSKSMGQTFIVENKPGAGGILGTEAAKNAPPDGYTLTACPSGPFGINPGIYSKLPYDPIKDFEPISNLVLTPQVIVVGSQTPYLTLKDLLAAAKAKPGEIAYGSLGTGSTSHLTMEALQQQAGVKMNHIPFKGGAEAQTQIMGGAFPTMSDTITGVLTQVRAGKLRAVGVAIPQRSPYLPNVPTIAEQGFPGFESVGWIGLCAPAHTPAAILDKLNAEVRKMLASPAARARIDELAFTPVGNSRKEFGDWIRAEIAKWSKIAKD